MTRFLSLCSQHCACGVLADTIKWLSDECEGQRVPGRDEVQVGKEIGKAECVGFPQSDPLDSLAVLSSIAYLNTSEWDIQIQTFGYTALLLQRIMKMGSPCTHSTIDKTLTNKASQIITSAHGDIGLLNHIEMKQVIELLQQASDMGSGDASFILGVCCFEGDYVAQDKEIAIELFQQAAEDGNANAMYKLALCYEDGIGVVKDNRTAFGLYQKAAEMGHACAMYRLAVFNEYGHMRDGAPTDVDESRKWYKQSADLGNKDAIQALMKGHPFLTFNFGLP